MRIYASRKECEIILRCLYDKMKDMPINELPEYNNLAQKILEVNAKQCKKDKSTYDGYDGCELLEESNEDS